MIGWKYKILKSVLFSFNNLVVDETLHFSIFLLKVNIPSYKMYMYPKILIPGPCTSYPTLGTFCGQSTPTYIQSNGLYVLINFTTDASVTNKGFNISYYLEEG